MANKKITQLASKTAVLSTDLFPIGDAATGTLYKKTIAELQAAIGGAVVSVNGKVGVVVLTTDDVIEAVSPTNLYFTNTRARGAISLTTTGSSGASTYSSSTGVLNVPTYTLAGLGGITATFLSGGTGISYNSGTGVISYSGTIYTDSSVRGLFSAETGLSYNSATGAFSYSGTIYTDASIKALFSGGTGITYNSTTGAISYSGTIYTDASIKALFSGTSPITYNSTTGAIGITGANLTESTSSVLTITGGTGALISAASIQVKQASGSQSGFLSSTDWTTFNGKQNALTNPVTGTSTSGYVAFFNGSTTITGDSGHFWDNTNKRLGIGTTSPSYPLHIYSTTNLRLNIEGTTNYVATQYNNTGGAFYMGIDDSAGTNFTGSGYARFLYSGGSYPMIFTTNGSERVRITSDGLLGIGTSSPTRSFQITRTSTAFINAEGSSVAIGSSNAAVAFFANNNNSINLTTGGNILMGTSTDNGERLYVSGAIRATGTITANSDITLKKNLLKIENALQKVGQINGYTYEFKEDDSKRHAGVIAQEIQEVLPEIVNKGNDGILGVEYGNISALLIEAIKEQQTQINELKALLNK
jgi:hypothetical protein